jgi:methylmalonyl-CoA mutase cobalamin-binding subunit
MIWIDSNVPKEVKGYVRNKYLGRENNYIKGGNEQCPSYKKLKDMGIDENYSAIFINEE